MGKNPKINSSTDWNNAETVGKISKINSSTGTLIQHRRVVIQNTHGECSVPDRNQINLIDEQIPKITTFSFVPFFLQDARILES